MAEPIRSPAAATLRELQLIKSIPVAGFRVLVTMLDAVGNAVINMFDLSSPDTFRMISGLMIVYVVTATPLVAWVAYDLLRKKPQKAQVTN